MSKFFKGIQSKDIFLGNIYTTIIPFSTPQPLSLFESCTTCESNKMCNGFNENCGRKYNDGQDFDRDKMSQFQNNDSEISVIVPHKIRPAVVIQPDDYNHRDNYPFVFVAPIQTLHREKIQAKKLKKILANELPQLHYIGDHTGHEAYINISDIKRLHKSFLLEKHSSDPFSDDIMLEVLIKISSLLGMGKGKIAACKTCEMNCDNCSLKNMPAVSE